MLEKTKWNLRGAVEVYSLSAGTGPAAPVSVSEYTLLSHPHPYNIQSYTGPCQDQSLLGTHSKVSLTSQALGRTIVQCCLLAA